MLSSFTILIMLLYINWMLRLVRGWKKGSVAVVPKADDEPLVSVVVCFHNEEKRLAPLLEALAQQSYQRVEYVFVDDQSTDRTYSMLSGFAAGRSNAMVVRSFERGKKKALRQGVSHATGELILTTDADCRPGRDWIATMVHYFSSTRADLLIGAVRIAPVSGFPGKLQQLEFATLVASGMASAAVGRPFMANGANLAVRRSVFAELSHRLNDAELSGDDVFLLHAVKRNKGKIVPVFSSDAMVETEGVGSLSAFFRQRLRWASKSPSYRDTEILFTQALVSSVNLLMLLWCVLPHTAWPVFVLAVTSKLSVDCLFVSRFRHFFNIPDSPGLVAALFAGYPFYVLITAVSVLLAGRGRRQW